MGAPTDRVRVFKLESPSGGGTQDDEGFQSLANPNQDALSVQGIFLQKPKAGLPIEEDELVYLSRNADGEMVFTDVAVGVEYTLEDLTASAGGGITELQHDALDDLTHWIAETNFQEVVRSGGKVTNVINWTDSGKTVKIREMVITRTAGKVSQMDFIQYDGAGVEKQRMTGVITRTAGKVSSVQWTETGS